MPARLFSFPNPVNETAARVVAGGVVALAAVELATGQRWLLIPLAYGFLARVLSGPADVLVALLIVAATLESVFGICLECADISKRINPGRTTATVPHSHAAHDRV